MRLIAGIVLAVATFLYAGLDFTIAESPTVDPYQSIWAPTVTPDCDTGEWVIQQTPAALEDVWLSADYMMVNGSGTYDTEPVRLPKSQSHSGPTHTFTFEFHNRHGAIYAGTIGGSWSACQG